MNRRITFGIASAVALGAAVCRGEIADGAYVIIPLCPFTSVVPPSYDQRPSAETHPLQGRRLGGHGRHRLM